LGKHANLEAMKKPNGKDRNPTRSASGATTGYHQKGGAWSASRTIPANRPTRSQRRRSGSKKNLRRLKRVHLECLEPRNFVLEGNVDKAKARARQRLRDLNKEDPEPKKNSLAERS